MPPKKSGQKAPPPEPAPSPAEHFEDGGASGGGGVGVSDELVTLSSIDGIIARHFAAANMTDRFDRIEGKLDTLSSSIDKHETAITAQSEATKKLAARVGKMERCLVDQQKHADAIAKLEQQAAFAEDRNRRDNARFLNLKEGLEASNAISYLTMNLPIWFPSLAAEWRSPPEIMRAHRIGRYNPSTHDKTPRVLIVKFLRYTDKDRILKESRKSPAKVAGHTIRVTSDYSEYTTALRKPCFPIMDRARDLGCETFLIYPAAIKLVLNRKEKIFTKTDEAEALLDKIEAGDDVDDEFT